MLFDLFGFHQFRVSGYVWILDVTGCFSHLATVDAHSALIVKVEEKSGRVHQADPHVLSQSDELNPEERKKRPVSTTDSCILQNVLARLAA